MKLAKGQSAQGQFAQGQLIRGVLFFVCVVCLASCGGADLVGDSGGETVDSGTTDLQDSSLLQSKTLVTTATPPVVGVQAGYISDGNTITLPTDATGAAFAIATCVMTAAPATISGSAISTRATVDSLTGRVTCKKVVQSRVEVPAEEQGCVASYTVICVQ